MAKPLTHRERAERAARIIVDGGCYAVDSELTEPTSRTIARETFPRELVEAARALLETIDEHATGSFGDAEDALEDALALYEEEPAHD